MFTLLAFPANTAQPLRAAPPKTHKEQAMSLESATQAIRSKVGDDSGLEATLKFDLGADGVIVIDGKSTPNTVSNTNTETDCTVGITLDNLQAMLDGDLEPATGFMAGKLKVTGDMAVAMRLQRVI
jgi:putative sterol carrier protein